MKTSTKIWMISGAIITAATMAGLAVSVYQHQKPSSQTIHEQTQRFRDDLTGFELEIPNGLVRASLSEQDQKDRVGLRLTSSGGVPVSVVVRSEAELKAANPSGKDLLTQLLDNSGLSFPKTFPDYNVISQKQFEIDGTRAGQVLFTYANQDVTIKQRFVIVIKDSDVAQYLVFQAPVLDFDMANSRYFEPMVRSARYGH